MSVTAYVLILALVAMISAVIKLQGNPQKRAFRTKWNDKVGTVHTDVKCGKHEANLCDIYVPADSTKSAYGLVVYLHSGDFSTGDKKNDAEILKWLCSKGYVAAGVNYSLSGPGQYFSVYDQSQEIKAAIPKVIAKAERLGYRIDSMAIAGSGAGGALAALYAMRDGKKAPVPVKMVFEMVGPVSFCHEDWTNYGLDKNPEAAANLFTGMCGREITPEMITDNAYTSVIKDISADMWVTEKSVPVLMAYGTHDKVCPCGAGRRFAAALEKHGVPHDFFELPHSGHGLQNDDRIYKKFLRKISEYLDTYLPVK